VCHQVYPNGHYQRYQQNIQVFLMALHIRKSVSVNSRGAGGILSTPSHHRILYGVTVTLFGKTCQVAKSFNRIDMLC
jgi:hypothetical protein